MSPEVRKHRAPKGALRLETIEAGTLLHQVFVRKHRAPKGALRLELIPDGGAVRAIVVVSQIAPSAKRCIKTKTPAIPTVQAVTVSESTERQTVH